MARYKYGTFVDAVAGLRIPGTGQFITTWKSRGTAPWREYADTELTKDLVLAFLREMSLFFRDTIAQAASERRREMLALWEITFFSEAREVAEQYGIKVTRKEIIELLTPVVAGVFAETA